MSHALRLPAGALIVLVAPSGTGKSTWANRHLGPSLVVSSDQLRGVVGADEHDQRASADAFALLDQIVAARCRRGLTTVVDSTGLQADRRAAYRALAGEAGVPCIAVVLDVPEKAARARNKARERPVPAKAVTSQWQQFAATKERIDGEDFATVHVVTDLDLPARIVEAGTLEAAAIGDGPNDVGQAPRLHLHLGRFSLGSGEARHELAQIARTAEEVGFAGIWLMDHLLQIPQVGRAWDDLPESWTTLAWLAAHTERIRLGSLVSPVTFRPMAVLAKAVATVDVLSGGRVTCGLGLGWFETEHRELGVELPSRSQRYDLLQDHLEGLPLLWGPGTPSFDGRAVRITKATSYPRPAQPKVPILVGGNGPTRTLRLAAAHADAVNLQGDVEAVRAGIAALHGHLDQLGRDRSEVSVTARVTAMTRPNVTALDAAVAGLLPAGSSPDTWRASSGAAIVEDQVARMRGLGQLGVQDVMVSVTEASVEGIAAFAPVISALA